MKNTPISTVPLSENEELLRKKFYESITTQSDLMDKLGVQLLTLELAIPGLFATVLKLKSGDAATVTVNFALNLTFLCWVLALILTLVALTPKNWNVDPDHLKTGPAKI